MLKVAVIGLGKMGLLHASLLNTIDGMELVALCEKSRLIRRFGRKAIGGVEMAKEVGELAGLGLDMVYVATPPSSHYPIVVEIYRKCITKNIFVEKPLTDNYYQSEMLCGLSEHLKGVCMVGYNRRYNVAFRRAKEILGSGVLGKLFHFEGYAYSSDLVGVNKASGSLEAIGVLRDLGCHIIDLALWYFGGFEVEMVSGDMNVWVRTHGGLRGEIRSSWRKEGYRVPEIGLRIVGSEGQLDVNDDRVVLRIYGKSMQVWNRHDLRDNVSYFLGDSSYCREDEAFVSAVKNGNNSIPDFRTALMADRVIAEVERMRVNSG